MEGFCIKCGYFVLKEHLGILYFDANLREVQHLADMIMTLVFAVSVM